MLFTVFSIISSFCSSPRASTPLLAKSAISTEKYDFVAALITSFLPSAMTWRGRSISLRLPATLPSRNTFLGPAQGSQLKGTHQTEYAFQSSFCPNREGCYFVLFQGSLHRQARSADRLFKGKAGACDSLQHQVPPQSSPISTFLPPPNHRTTTLPVEITCISENPTQYVLQKTNSVYLTFKK